MKLSNILQEIEFTEGYHGPTIIPIGRLILSTSNAYYPQPSTTTTQLKNGFTPTTKRQDLLNMIEWVKDQRRRHTTDFKKVTIPDTYEVYSGVLNKDILVVGAWIIQKGGTRGRWMIYCMVYHPHLLAQYRGDDKKPYRWFGTEGNKLIKEWLLPSALKLLNSQRKKERDREL